MVNVTLYRLHSSGDTDGVAQKLTICCFYRDNSLFSSVMDYLSVEKGWFSPYLFASGRRPIIPRSVKPDIVFCHGPFLSGTSSLAYHLNRLVRPSHDRVTDLAISHCLSLS